MLSIAPPRTNSGTRLLGAVIEQPAHLLGVQVCHAAACRCGAHGSHQVVRVFDSGTHSLHCPHSDVVTGVTARKKCVPLMPNCSPSASAAGTIAQPGCAPPPA